MALLHEVEAETLQITRFRKVGCRKSYAFAGLRTAPATHRARNTANTTFSCRMLQNTGFGTIPWGGGGGGSEPRTGIIYVYINYKYIYIYVYIHTLGGSLFRFVFFLKMPRVLNVATLPVFLFHSPNQPAISRLWGSRCLP